MPTLVWRRRPNNGAGAAEGGHGKRAGVAAVPEPVVSAATPAVPDSVVSAIPADPAVSSGVALPAPSSKPSAGGRKKRKHELNPTAAQPATMGYVDQHAWHAQQTYAAYAQANWHHHAHPAYAAHWGQWEHISSAGYQQQDQPTAMREYFAQLAAMGYSPEEQQQAWAAYTGLGAQAAQAAEDGTADRKEALEEAGGYVSRKATAARDLPIGIRKKPSGRFKSLIWWGDKQRYIGTFDTLEQASAAYDSVREDLDNADLSPLGADEVDGLFDEAQKKAVEAVGGVIPKKNRVRETPKRDHPAEPPERRLPQGVSKMSTGKFGGAVWFVPRIWWGDKERYIGTFDTLEQASAAYMSARKDLDDANLSSCGANEVNAAFDAARRKAAETVGGVVPRKMTPRSERGLPTGVYNASSVRMQYKVGRQDPLHWYV